MNADEFLVSLGDYHDEPEPGTIEVQDEGWSQEGKRQTCTVVFYHLASLKYFAVTYARSGNYYSGWEHDDAFCVEVFKRVVSKTEYCLTP